MCSSKYHKWKAILPALAASKNKKNKLKLGAGENDVSVQYTIFPQTADNLNI